MKKKTKKESHKKTRKIFKTQKKDKTRTKNCKKKCPAKKEIDKIILKVKRNKTENERFAEVYKDTKQKNCEKGFWLRKQRDNKRQRKNMKKGGKEKATREHRETKKRTSGFRKNKRLNKEAKQTFWKGKCWEGFLVWKQWRVKKRKCQNEPTQIFIQRKKSFHVKKTGWKRKHKGIFRPSKKKGGNKWETLF